MSPLFNELLRSIAQHHTGPLPERRYCCKCCSYQPKEGGTGMGRQYRCGVCTKQRAAALAKRKS